MKRTKSKHVNLIPDAVKQQLAVKELAEIKRRKTVGVKYNSATVFSIMWFAYCCMTVAYSFFQKDFEPCKYWAYYLALRLIVLVPSSFLAWCWKIGWWSRKLPNPETIGVILAAYIATIVTIGFTTELNGNCNLTVPVVAATVKVRLTGPDAIFQLRRDACDVYSPNYAAITGECQQTLTDERTYFEASLFQWVGQLIVVLFAFTSLFKPSKHATIFYTAVVWLIGVAGCAYQGLEFWQNKERVEASDIGMAIFLFVSGALVNIHSANTMHTLERNLVNVSTELNDDRVKAPSGPRVVFVKAEVAQRKLLQTQISANALEECEVKMRALMQALAKEYFGTELTMDNELEKLYAAAKDGKVMDAATVAKIQELMKETAKAGQDMDAGSGSFLLAFHNCYDAVSFALTFQDELMLQAWHKDLEKCALGATVNVELSSVEKESRARAMSLGHYGRYVKDTDILNLIAFRGLRMSMGVHMGPSSGGIKGPTVQFTDRLAGLAEGGMVLVSPPVADVLAGALDQLAQTAASAGRRSTLVSAATLEAERQTANFSVPRLVGLGVVQFEGAGLFHASEEETFAAEKKAVAGGAPAGGHLGLGSQPGSPAGAAQTPSGRGRTGTIITDQYMVSNDDSKAGVEMAPVLLPDGRILTSPAAERKGQGATTGSIELFHIYHTPLFGRHIHWDDANMRLKGTTSQVTLGYYDAPVQRENRPDLAVVLFGDVQFAHHLHSEDAKTFTEANIYVLRVMQQLLVKHHGYNVPQREGHFMQVFSHPRRAIEYHVELQQALMGIQWPKAYKSHPLTRPLRDDTNVEAARMGSGGGDTILYKGLVVSMGMSVGRISKGLERSRANYLGPTCNRSARLCGLAKHGQLLMCLEEFDAEHLASCRRDAGPRGKPLVAEIMHKNAVLKGIKGEHDIVALNTDALTMRRRIVQRIPPKNLIEAEYSNFAAPSTGVVPVAAPANPPPPRMPRGSSAAGTGI